MTVLVIGSGGREHAIAWKLAQSPRVERVIVAPGNAGTAVGAIESRPVAVGDRAGIVALAKAEKAGLAVIGPDDALAAGLADDLRAAGVPAFGPSRAAARIESSKAYAKAFMQRHGIPTARSMTFASVRDALRLCDELGYPVVIKADGLALGKGVVIAASRDEAQETLVGMMEEGRFGEAGRTVLVEEFLEGLECSIHALVDGHTARVLETVQDHKRAGDGDTGPNTGGMGSFSPAREPVQAALDVIEREVVGRFLDGMRADGVEFRGLLFPGVMLGASGPRVLEFNARFGDPETQVLMRRLDCDLLPQLEACATGELHLAPPLRWREAVAVCVVMASGGYPGSHAKGFRIEGIDRAEGGPGEVVVFHAGTRRQAGQIETNGGRVLGVTALGDTHEAAVANAYAAVDSIAFPNAQWRTDIGRPASCNL